ncbi:MAG: DUF1499 domain-containing protein [Acidaminobacteraceae bacterium]
MKFVLALAIVIVLFGADMKLKNSKLPKKLGVSNGRLSELPNSPNGVSTQTSQTNKLVDVLKYKEDGKITREKIKKICMDFANSKLEAENDFYMRFVFTTEKMKYKDDVEFLFDDENKVVHYRSNSRVGYSDMGLNMERYLKIVDSYTNKV